jgi:hypothetical protein
MWLRVSVSLCACLVLLPVVALPNKLGLTDETLLAWDTLSLFDKAPLLIDDSEKSNLRDEFTAYGASGGEDCISYEAFLNRLSEFQSLRTILTFWNYCDVDMDKRVCYDEYLHCRGEFEQNGNRYDFNEYEFLEKLIMDDIQDELRDLAERKRMQEHEYDENGIIID